MTYQIWIKCDNAAFHPFPEYEIKIILQKLVRKFENGMPIEGEGAEILMDSNGNRVGEAKMITEEGGDYDGSGIDRSV
jgi:hypothetical protein